MARSLDLLRDTSKNMAGVLRTVEDLQTALKIITLKSTGFWFSFWNIWFLYKEIADEIQATSRLLKLHALLEQIYLRRQIRRIQKQQTHWRRLWTR